MTIQKSYPHILIIGSLIGLLASFFLMLDTLKIIEDPMAQIPCNLNPFINCGNAIISEQGAVFGFPNPLLGIISFSMLFAIGVMLFSGGRSRKPLWLLVNLGTFASTIFVIWFFHQSLFALRSLCLYCMVVWTVTWPLFFYTTLWNFKEDHFKFEFLKVKAQQKIDNFFNIIHKNQFQFFSLWYIAIILGILFRFRDFFLY